jgi:hypothetical protein
LAFKEKRKKPALALDKKAENARELGLDYEPVQEPQVFGPPIGILMKMEGDETRKLYPLKQKPAPVQEPVAFEEWLAKQHGDPEEIGFLQALRIAYIAGQDSITTPPAQPAPACTRSHPHENMDAMCELRTEIARLTNENARLKAQPAPVPLTDEQIDAIRFSILTKAVTQRDFELARAIEAAHGITKGQP